MKHHEIIGFFIVLFCVIDSYSMKRSSWVYEQEIDSAEGKEQESDKDATRKIKANDPSIEILSENNNIERILPAELIEHILLFYMISVFNDALDAFERSAPNCSAETDNLEKKPPFNRWLTNTPYPKMILFRNRFPEESLCRKLMEVDSFKRKLRGYTSKTIVCFWINFFIKNDAWAGKFLRDIMLSIDLPEYSKSRFAILLFARCLAEAGIHPNQRCHLKQKEICLIKPFCLLELAIYIGDYDFAENLIYKKKGNIDKVSKYLNCLTAACKNDSILLFRLSKYNKIGWFQDEIIKALTEAIRNKSYKVLAEGIRSLIEKNLGELFKELIDNGLDVNQPNLFVYDVTGEEPFFHTTQETPLMISVKKNNFEFTKKLIKKWNADVNARTVDGASALYYCDDSDDGIKIAEYLVLKGADVNFKG